MERYCENCGAKIKENSQFCTKCGSKVTNKKICPNCGETNGKGASFCESCGNALTTTVKNESFLEKYKLPLIILLVIVIVAIAIPMTSLIIDQSIGSQEVTVDGYNFKIPENFIYNSTASDRFIEERIVHKDWNRSEESIEIAVLYPSDENGGYEDILPTLGGYKETKYGIDGYHNHFENGEEAFSYTNGNKMIMIAVSNPELFDKIEVL